MQVVDTEYLFQNEECGSWCEIEKASINRRVIDGDVDYLGLTLLRILWFLRSDVQRSKFLKTFTSM